MSGGITLEKPNIDDLRKGLGKNKYNWYRWSACESCGKERWVEIIKGELRNRMCVRCSDRSKQVEAMRIANLGATCSQATRDKISQARQQKVWEYAKVPPINPFVGDKAVVNRHSCIWFACSMCGRERWVRVKRGGIPSCETCVSCCNQLEQKKQKIRDSQWSLTQRDATLKRLMSAQNIRPNKPEKQLSALLNELYPSQWQYTGGGKLIIGGRNPDFWNGDHKLIELFGDYWHGDRARCYEETEGGRIALFSKYGYRMLIVWERELKDEELLIQRIQEFVE